MQSEQKRVISVQARPRYRRGDGKHPIDQHVGKVLRMRRTLLGLSQESLSEALGITFQQLQKYESAANRISASRLWDIAKILEVDVEFFFEGAPDAVDGKEYKPSTMPSRTAGVAPRRETLELVRAYYRIQDDSVRSGILEMVKAMAPSESAMAAAE